MFGWFRSIWTPKKAKAGNNSLRSGKQSVLVGRDVISSTINIGADVSDILLPLRDVIDHLRPVPTTHRVKILRFIEHYRGTTTQPVPFGGRNEQLNSLREWIENPFAARQLLITGPAGRGKTALVVHWIDRISDDWQVVFFPI